MKKKEIYDAMMLRDSRDGRVRTADIKIRTARKWSASRALHDAEDHLHHTDTIGTIDQGCTTRASWTKAEPKERWGMVQKEIHRMEEESRQARAVAMGKQGGHALGGESG